ncbi:hypothetical protein V3331_02895 [Gaopeijia maritima]|uniref:hypothetical protein n=1 Tax=Gaopeijia maritima TaxID=3119007 RepID=UPI00324EA501
MEPDSSSIVPLVRALLILGPLIIAFLPGGARGASSPPFGGLMGEWRGVGVLDGGELRLHRVWTRELGENAISARLTASAEDGRSFEVITLYHRTGPERFRAIWTDGGSPTEEVDVVLDARSGLYSAQYMDRRADGRAGWRRWELQMTGRDSFEERVYRLDERAPVLLTRFSFTRKEQSRG